MLIPKCALIRAALIHVNKQQKGASLVQVRKHLEATYDEKLDAKKKKLIHTTFKALIQEGKLQRKGTIYKSTKVSAIACADVPHRRRRRSRRRRRRRSSRRRHRRRRSSRQRRRRRHHHHCGHHGRHHHRSKHHRRHHRRRRHHGKHHHRSRHHRRHHHGHHHEHHHELHHHSSRHHNIDVNESSRQYKHHGRNVPVEVPMDKLALSPTTSNLSQKKT